ncbi:MAG: M6 family metalloprotease domain-containing protein, partial [candidate division Zixibacteria bacterium]|nr:M6 family metalloprotease domain-containing protein [candidate division Zixibacteria bacterium]
SGSGAEYSGSNDDIWSHKWSTNTPIQKDGVYVFNYTIQPEYWNTAGDMTIGVYAHELGHVFGLPDLYDTDYSSNGIGRWGIMSFGSWGGPGNDGSSPAHPCAWSKIQMGFVTPTNVLSNTPSVSISNVEQNPTIYRLWNSGASSTEYFLVENRQKLGYDSYIPGDGLLIWHIDESQSSNDNQWFPGEDSTSHFLVALEQADGLFEIEQMNDYGDAGDPFPGTADNTSFDGLSLPNSDTYVDGGTFVKVDNIQTVGYLLVADFTVGISANIGDEINPSLPSEFVLEQNYPNPFNPKTSINFTLNRNAYATLNVYNILGEKVKTIIDDNLIAGEFNIEWDAIDDNGNKLSSGIYLYRLKVGEQIESKKMVLLK